MMNTTTDDIDNECREEEMAEATTTTIWFDEENKKYGQQPTYVRFEKRKMWIAN